MTTKTFHFKQESMSNFYDEDELDTTISELLEYVDSDDMTFSKRESDFIIDIAEQWENKRSVSEKQFDEIERLYLKL